MSENGNNKRDVVNGLTAEEYQRALLTFGRNRVLSGDFFEQLAKKLRSDASPETSVTGQSGPPDISRSEVLRDVRGNVKKVMEPEKSKESTEERFRDYFDDAFFKCFGDAENIRLANEQDQKALREIVNFRNRHVMWATVKNGAYIALGNGRPRGYMAMMPSDHPFARDQNNVFQVSRDKDVVNLLFIAPTVMNKAWAAIGLCHGLYYIYARAAGIESDHPTRKEFLLVQANAVRTEIAAADYCSEGRYSKVLEQVIGSLGSISVQQFLTMIKNRSSILTKGVAMLDSAVGYEKPKSNREKGLRQGFHSQAMLLEFGIQNAERLDSNIETMVAEMFKLFMIMNGAERYLPAL